MGVGVQQQCSNCEKSTGVSNTAESAILTKELGFTMQEHGNWRLIRELKLNPLTPRQFKLCPTGT